MSDSLVGGTNDQLLPLRFFYPPATHPWPPPAGAVCAQAKLCPAIKQPLHSSPSTHPPAPRPWPPPAAAACPSLRPQPYCLPQSAGPRRPPPASRLRPRRHRCSAGPTGQAGDGAVWTAGVDTPASSEQPDSRAFGTGRPLLPTAQHSGRGPQCNPAPRPCMHTATSPYIPLLQASESQQQREPQNQTPPKNSERRSQHATHPPPMRPSGCRQPPAPGHAGVGRSGMQVRAPPSTPSICGGGRDTCSMIDKFKSRSGGQVRAPPKHVCCRSVVGEVKQCSMIKK